MSDKTAALGGVRTAPRLPICLVSRQDSRMPLGPLDPPVRGSFRDGIGTFYGDDTFNGKPIRVRFDWSRFTPTHVTGSKRFSTDGGISWETNWVMDFQRVQWPLGGSRALEVEALATRHQRRSVL